MNLYHFQKESIEKFFTRAKRRCLVSIPTGGGKTIVALSILKRIYEENKNVKTLVVAPANLRRNFIDNANRLGFHSLFKIAIVYDKSTIRNLYDENSILIVSYNFLYLYYREFIKQLNFDFVICDELHYGKEFTSRTAESCFLLSENSKMFLGLTASFVHNTIDEFLSIMAIVLADKKVISKGKQYIKWEEVGRIDPGWLRRMLFGAKVKRGVMQQVGLTNQEKFRQLFIDHIYIPLSEKVEVTSRPQLRSFTVRVRLTESESRAYKIAEGSIPKLLLKLLQLGQINSEQMRKIKNQIIACQQVLLTPDYIFHGREPINVTEKVRKCAELILSSNKEKSIVFTPFTQHGSQVIERYFRSVGINCAEYSGKLNQTERESIISSFETRDLEVIVLTQAGKEGINLPACKNVYILSSVFNPQVLEQVVGRALRVTSKNPFVNVYWFFAYLNNGNETVDSWIESILQRKRVLAKILTKLFSESKRERLIEVV